MAQFDYNSKFEDIGVPRQDWVEQEINNTSYTSEYESKYLKASILRVLR